MKHFFCLLVAALLLTGCGKQGETARVRVHVDDFSISQEDFPSKSDTVVHYNNVKAITLAFYTAGGSEQYQVTQMRDDHTTYTTFGEFDCDLPMGSYTMVVIGRGHSAGDVLTLTSPTSAAYTSGRVREVFATTQVVNVTNTDELSLNATLSRIVPKVRLVSTDLRTANADSIRFTFSAGGKSFNPTTGLATVNTGFVNTVKGSGNTGQTMTATSYLFLATDQQTMDVTIDVLNSDNNVVFHKELEDVPLQRNKITTMKGQMFTAGAESTFLINTDYISDTTFVTF